MRDAFVRPFLGFDGGADPEVGRDFCHAAVRCDGFDPASYP